MNKFKVGDKVRYNKHSIIHDEEFFAINEVYIIERIQTTRVIYLRGIGIHVNPRQIEPAQIPNTKLARKLNPNSEISEDGKWVLL